MSVDPVPQPMVPATPTPDIMPIIGSVIRAVGAYGIGVGAGWAVYVTGSNFELLMTVIALLVPVAWGIYNKFYLEWRNYRTAIASARGGKAVQPPAVIP